LERKEGKRDKKEGSLLYEKPTSLFKGDDTLPMIIPQWFSEIKTYVQRFSQIVWKPLLSGLKCAGYSKADPCDMIRWGTWVKKPKGLGACPSNL